MSSVLPFRTARFPAFVRNTLRAAGELIFPPECAGCKRTITGGEGYWCLDCAKKVLAITSMPYCCRCGGAPGPYLFDEDGCPDCRQIRIRPTRFVRIGAYHDLVGRTLAKFKLSKEHRLDACLGALLADHFAGQPWIEKIDAIVPVPTTWRRRLHHKAWPVGLIAAQVSRRLDIPSLPLVYVKGKKTPQVGLPASSRGKNIRGVYHVSPHARISGATLCLIDDVSTTGSTIREITKILLDAGAAEVYAGVIAKTDPRRSDDDLL